MAKFLQQRRGAHGAVGNELRFDSRKREIIGCPGDMTMSVGCPQSFPVVGCPPWGMVAHPHAAVGSIFSDIADAAKGIVDSVAPGLRQASPIQVQFDGTSVQVQMDESIRRAWGAAADVANFLPSQVNKFVKDLGVPAAVADILLPGTPIARTWGEFVSDYHRALPVVQHSIRNIQPFGPAASAALGVLGAAIRTGSLEEVAWAAAEGAAPSGVNMAVTLARSAMQGQPAMGVVLDAAESYFKGTPAESAARAARSLAERGRFSDADLYGLVRSLPGGISVEAATTIFDAARKVAGGRSPLDMVAGFALAQFDPDSPAAMGAKTAIDILRSGNPTAAALAAARANMPPEFQAGMDAVTGAIARRGTGAPLGRPTPQAAASSTLKPPVIQFTGDAWPASVIAAAMPVMVSSAGFASTKAPPPVVTTTADMSRILAASASPAVPPQIRTTASAMATPVIATTKAPPALPYQPNIRSGEGLLVRNDRSIVRGRFNVSSSGVPGILVLSDGRLVRQIFQ